MVLALACGSTGRYTKENGMKGNDTAKANIDIPTVMCTMESGTVTNPMDRADMCSKHVDPTSARSTMDASHAFVAGQMDQCTKESGRKGYEMVKANIDIPTAMSTMGNGRMINRRGKVFCHARTDSTLECL